MNRHGVFASSELQFRLNNVFFNTGNKTPLVDALFISGDRFDVAAGFGKAGQPQRGDRRELGGHPDRRMDD